MSMFDDAKEKAQQYAEDNPDKVESVSDQGLDRASDAAGEATGGKFDDKIQQGRDAGDARIGE